MEIGSLAAWASAVLTGGGLLATAYQLRASRADAKAARVQAQLDEEQRREAMARAVGVKVSWQPNRVGEPPSNDGLMPAHVEVLNGGEFPICGVVLELATDRGPAEIVYGTILPGEHLKDTHEVHRTGVVFGELTGGATLLFTDTYGNHWARSTDTLERRDQPARIC